MNRPASHRPRGRRWRPCRLGVLVGGEVIADVAVARSPSIDTPGHIVDIPGTLGGHRTPLPCKHFSLGTVLLRAVLARKSAVVEPLQRIVLPQRGPDHRFTLVVGAAIRPTSITTIPMTHEHDDRQRPEERPGGRPVSASSLTATTFAGRPTSAGPGPARSSRRGRWPTPARRAGGAELPAGGRTPAHRSPARSAPQPGCRSVRPPSHRSRPRVDDLGGRRRDHDGVDRQPQRSARACSSNSESRCDRSVISPVSAGRGRRRRSTPRRRAPAVRPPNTPRPPSELTIRAAIDRAASSGGRATSAGAARSPARCRPRRAGARSARRTCTAGPVGAAGAHGQQRDLVVDLDDRLGHHPVGRAGRRDGPLPRRLDIVGPQQHRLPVARCAGTSGLTTSGNPAWSATAASSVDRTGEPERRRRQAQFVGGQPTQALAIQAQPRAARRRNHFDRPVSAAASASAATRPVAARPRSRGAPGRSTRPGRPGRSSAITATRSRDPVSQRASACQRRRATTQHPAAGRPVDELTAQFAGPSSIDPVSVSRHSLPDLSDPTIAPSPALAGLHRRITGWPVCRKWSVACWCGLESQHPTCPHARHIRRCAQVVSPVSVHSWQRPGSAAPVRRRRPPQVLEDAATGSSWAAGRVLLRMLSRTCCAWCQG